MIEAAEWLQSQGQPLWNPSDLTPDRLRRHVRPDEIFVGYVEKVPAVACLIQTRDPWFWPGVEDSYFVHKLSVARRFSSQGYGAEMLAWAARHALSAGQSFLRLDCAADRPKLRRFYEGCGFRYVDLHRVDTFEVARYQRPLV